MTGSKEQSMTNKAHTIVQLAKVARPQLLADTVVGPHHQRALLGLLARGTGRRPLVSPSHFDE